MFECKNMTFAYQEDVIFSNIDFKVNEGEYVLIIGANGSGKSTFLKCLLGLLEPTSGEVFIEDIPIKKYKNWSNIGYVAQRAAHVDISVPVSVEEVVGMGADKPDKAKIMEQLKIVNMEEYFKSDIHKLSGGQQQRVFIARALMSEPKVLVFDEPTVGLDVKSTNDFYDLVGLLHKQGKTVLMVTHDMHLLTKEATRVVEINRKIAFNGTKEEYKIWHDNNCVYCDDIHLVPRKEQGHAN